MSGYKCGGLVYTSDTLMTMMSSDGKDMSSIDPNGLLLAKDKDFDDLSATKALEQKGEDGTFTWEDFTKVCKEWGEAKEHGKAFCC